MYQINGEATDTCRFLYLKASVEQGDTVVGNRADGV